jgi:Legume lectin domain
VPIQAFSTTFDFQLLDANADGFAFVIQSNGPNARGSAGGGLGYSIAPGSSTGASIPNSVAVKFDLHNNQGEGDNSTGVYIDGALPTVPAVDLTSSGIDLHSGDPFQAVISYSGTTLTLTLTDQTTHASFTHNFTVNIPQAVGGDTAYIGFTAGTWTETAIQNILSWTYTAQAIPYSGPALPSFANGFPESAGNVILGGLYSGSALELIPPGLTETTGEAYFINQVPAQSFSTDFTFQLGPASAANQGGDGFTFVMVNQFQGVSIGGTGGGLGYGPDQPNGNVGIPQSVAVKFDLHNNAGEGDNSTGLYLNGVSPTIPAINLTPSGINLHSGDTFHARIHYDGTNLYLSLTDLTDYAVYNGSFPVNIPQGVGGTTAYAGFTAGSGAQANQTEILNWSWFNN